MCIPYHSGLHEYGRKGEPIFRKGGGGVTPFPPPQKTSRYALDCIGSQPVPSGFYLGKNIVYFVDSLFLAFHAHKLTMKVLQL